MLVGYIGFSNTHMTVGGAIAQGMTNIWPIIPVYGGGTIQIWNDPTSAEGAQKWGAFDAQNRAEPPDVIWLQIGAKHPWGTVKRISRATRQVIVDVRTRPNLADVPIYLSAVSAYAPDTPGFTRIAWQECADGEVDLLADLRGLRNVFPGPVVPELTVATCLPPPQVHPNSQGITELGAALKAFPAFAA